MGSAQRGAAATSAAVARGLLRRRWPSMDQGRQGPGARRMEISDDFDQD